MIMFTVSFLNDSDFQKDTGLKGLSFSYLIDLLKNEWRYISSCYASSTV